MSEGQNVRRHSCSKCHRELSNPISVRAGMGPVCRAKLGVPTPNRKKITENRALTEWIPE